jgi:deoxyadenosine/deoxycytidine kinase
MKIAVGGMIASGKSTLVKNMSEYWKMPVLQEFDPNDKVFSTLLGWLYEGKENVEMLLQIYFLHKSYTAKLKSGHNVIVDRHIIEHWLFGQTNLAKYPEILNMYNGLFHQYMNSIDHPDFYLILDVDWDTFKERIMKRGREQEIENFGRNEAYFKRLMKDYVEKLVAQCVIYDIPFYVLDTQGLDEDEVGNMAIQVIEFMFKNEDIRGKDEKNIN